MLRLRGFSRVISLLLVGALAWAPALPSLAMTIKAGDAHAIHVTHDGNHGSVANSATTQQTPCTQHDSCSGHSCSFCAQSFSTVSLPLLDHTHFHPVQTPVLAALHPRLLVTSPERPPRFLSF